MAIMPGVGIFKPPFSKYGYKLLLLQAFSWLKKPEKAGFFVRVKNVP
jgi:hypothetical protein